MVAVTKNTLSTIIWAGCLDKSTILTLAKFMVVVSVWAHLRRNVRKVVFIVGYGPAVVSLSFMSSVMLLKWLVMSLRMQLKLASCLATTVMVLLRPLTTLVVSVIILVSRHRLWII